MSAHDMHHRLPRSKGGTNNKDNLVRVPQALHRAWHLLFRNWLPPEIAKELNRTWVSSKWRFVAFEEKPVVKKKIRVLHECKDYVIILKEKRNATADNGGDPQSRR